MSVLLYELQEALNLNWWGAMSESSIKCRVCDSALQQVWNLGKIANCGYFPDTAEMNVKRWNLNLARCVSCALYQLDQEFPLEEMYGDFYGYSTSLNRSMKEHVEEIAREITKNFISKKSKLYRHLDIGSNDGTLLMQIKEGVNELLGNEENKIHSFVGVDPSASKYESDYIENGLTLKKNFFCKELFNYERFDSITSIAMFYDVPRPISFAQDIRELLSEEGIWISEQSYLPRMVENRAFDTICHEHAEYYTLNDIKNICNESGLRIIHVSFNETNGGSFRFYACRNEANYVTQDSVYSALKGENLLDLSMRIKSLKQEVEAIRRQVREFLDYCAENDYVVHGLGASTKGNTLLQYFGINSTDIDCIAEVNPEKFGQIGRAHV